MQSVSITILLTIAAIVVAAGLSGCAPTEEEAASPSSTQQGAPDAKASDESQVYMFDNTDPEMQRACENARETFRHFWQEIAWEKRRIVPALDLACVKVAFSDGNRDSSDDTPQVEHMWVSEVDFDGKIISGVLTNSPNWLETVKEGDTVEVPLSKINDWMFAIDDNVYGAYTVNLMRSRMSSEEREAHDAAWGLDFGDPERIRTARSETAGNSEHPMSVAMAPSLRERLTENPEMIHERDDKGWTLLHHQSLAGSTATVKVLLEHGADPKAVTQHGMTPLQLAESLGWEEVATMLRDKATD